MELNIGSLVFSELFECGFYSLKVGKKNAVYYNRVRVRIEEIIRKFRSMKRKSITL